MRIYTSYGIRLKDVGKQFDMTVKLYRLAVQFFLSVCYEHWEALSELTGKRVNSAVEKLTVRTKRNPSPQHPFEDEKKEFYKFPCYLRRAAIAEAIGMCSSYQSRLKTWEAEEPKKRGRKPSVASETSMVMPAMYAGNMFLRTGLYTAKLKAFRDNTWDWIEVSLRKTDADYIRKHCSERKECVPVLQKRHRRYELRFAYKESVKLPAPAVENGTILSVDLGINNACTVCAMKKDGTVLLRRFLKLRRENDCLTHALNRIRKAQRNGAKKAPRLWAYAEGINRDISVKTARFILDCALEAGAHTIVMEALDLGKKKRGSKKQRLHHWKARYVQAMVMNKAHRNGIRLSRVLARSTSKLAYDGSGEVTRGTYLQDGIEKKNYSICVFQSGKTYNCDLNAALNIGARYYIRELIKPLSETARSGVEAKVPSCRVRATSTLSTLISLNAVLAA